MFRNRREIFHIRTRAVIKGHWKLHGKELFNLKEDISEKKNVAKEHPEIVQELQKLIEKHKADLKNDASPLTDADKL